MRKLRLSLIAGGLVTAALALATGPAVAKPSRGVTAHVADLAPDSQGTETAPDPTATTPNTTTQPSTDPSTGPTPTTPDSDVKKPARPKHDNKDKPKTKKKKKAPKSKPKGSSSSAEVVPLADISNTVIDGFDIPLFALQYYMAAGSMYGVSWELLASINYFETNFGTNLSVSSAGALGWMQFMPGTWAAYGVDADSDGYADPYSLPDAVFAAARYLRACVGDAQLNILDKNDDALRKAVFCYNHADWYVDEVLGLAKKYATLPPQFINTLVGLSSGYFPVRGGEVGYASHARGNTAKIVTGRDSAPVVAAVSGKIVKMTTDGMVLRDAFGNRYTYQHLASIEPSFPAPKVTPAALARFRRQAAKTIEQADSERNLPQPSAPATVGDPNGNGRTSGRKDSSSSAAGAAGAPGDPQYTPRGPTVASGKERLYAHPDRPRIRQRAAELGQAGSTAFPASGRAWTVFNARYKSLLKANPNSYELKPLEVGATVSAGTLLGRIGPTSAAATADSGLSFKVRPAGAGSPQIDPTPLLTTWKLGEQTSARGLLSDDPLKAGMSAGQVLLLPEDVLRARVLADPRIDIYPCGREDVRSGKSNVRVLGMLEYLAESGFRISTTSLSCGHNFLTASGSVSAHPFGDAADIAQVNGEPVLGHQQPGGLPDQLIDRLLALQGQWQPDQIISLIPKGAPNTLVLADHDDHVHVGYPFDPGNKGKSAQVAQRFKSMLSDDQWQRLGDRLSKIKNPIVPIKAKHSKDAIKVQPK